MPNEEQKKRAEIVIKAARDANFKKRLLQDPKKVLEENGIHLPGGITPKVLENNDTTHYFLLPSEKSLKKLGSKDLSKSAGGSGWCWQHQVWNYNPCN